MSSAEITTTTNQVYVYKGTGLNLHQAWVRVWEQLNTCTARSKLNTHTHTHSYTMHKPWKYRCVYFSELIHHTFTTDSFLPQGHKIISRRTEGLDSMVPNNNFFFSRKQESRTIFFALNCSLFLKEGIFLNWTIQYSLHGLTLSSINIGLIDSARILKSLHLKKGIIIAQIHLSKKNMYITNSEKISKRSSFIF